MTSYKNLNLKKKMKICTFTSQKRAKVLAFELVCKKPKYIRGTNCTTAGVKEVVHSLSEKVKIVFKIIFHI